MKINDIIHEGHDRIGTAIWKNTIPEEYRKYPMLGQGATSVVLDKMDGNVLMLTRDAMKKDWLVYGLDIAKWDKTIEVSHPKSRTLNDMPVYVLTMPKLQKLSSKNRLVVHKAISEYNRICEYGIRGRNYLQKYTAEHPDGIFASLVNFLSDYDEKQYKEDFLTRNFMQTPDGEIILVDPIIDRELLDELVDMHQRRHASSQSLGGRW